MIRKSVIAMLSVLVATLLVMPVAMAGPIDLAVDPKSGSLTDTYTFTVTWNIEEAPSFTPTFDNVELQYKKSASSNWVKYFDVPQSSWSGIIATPSEIKRNFNIRPAEKGSTNNAIGSYDFRVIDYNYAAVNPQSNKITIPFGNCERNVVTSIRAVEGNGYRKVTASDRIYNVNRDVFVEVDQNNNLGRGTKINYDYMVRNLDSGCGSESRYRLEILGSGVYVESVNGRTGHIAMSREMTIPVGTSKTIQLEIEASDRIAPGTLASGGVIFSLKNQGAIKAVSQETALIIVDEKRECVTRDPSVKFEPRTRNGFKGEEVEFLVTITNENIGDCDPERIRISHVGVQSLDSVRSGDGIVTDIDSRKWGFTAKYKSGSSVKETPFNSAGNTFDFTARYARYNPRTSVSFLLGNLDDFKVGSTRECKTCEKNIILKVRSASSDTGYSPRSIAFCVDKRNKCNSGVYNLVEPGTRPASVSDSGTKISALLLDTPETSPRTTTGPTVRTPPVTSDPKTTITRTTSTLPGGRGKTVRSVPGLDSSFFLSCKECTKQPLRGWKTTTNECANGVFDGSDDGKATRFGANWVFHPLERAKLLVIKDTARRSNSYSCDRPPKGVGTSPISTPSSSSQKTSSSNIEIDTDKNSYKAGEILTFSGTIGSAISTNVEIEIITPDGSTLTKSNYRTDSSGRFKSSGTIPSGHGGEWRIIARYGGLKDEEGFSVVASEEKPSETVVTIKIDRNSYRIGDIISVSGTVKTGSGSIIRSAANGVILTLNFVLPDGSSLTESPIPRAVDSNGRFAYKGGIPNLSNDRSKGEWNVFARYLAESINTGVSFEVV